MQLTFQEFRESRVFHKEGCDDAGLEGPGWVYADNTCHIEVEEDGTPYLVIHNQQWNDKTLEELEEILYFEFYICEVLP